MNLAVEPGQKIGEETITKTFQPSYVVTESGTLIVFCQGRLERAGDMDPKVILMNRSYDYGQTWQAPQIISAPMNNGAISAYTANLGGKERVSLLTCVGLKITKEYYQNDPHSLQQNTGIDLGVIGKTTPAVLCRFYSDDGGDTWHLETFWGGKSPLYKNYDGFTVTHFNTIGQVHVISEGPQAGRYITAGPVHAVPDGERMTSNFRNYPSVGSAIMYSDDNGETWSMDGIASDFLGNEASAVSINGGRQILMIRRLMRDDWRTFSKYTLRPVGQERIANISEDGGKTWSAPFLFPISSVRCHGTLARIGDRLYFSIPNGQDEGPQRLNGAIYFSDDEGQSWQHRIIEKDAFSYSTVGKLTDSQRITFYARGHHGDQGIAYRIFTDEWLEKANE